MLAKLALDLTASGWTFTYDDLTKVLTDFELQAHDGVMAGAARR